MKSSLKLILFLFVTFTAVGCDRVTKNLAKAHLAHQEPVSYFNDVFRLEYAENIGAAMSLGADWPENTRFWLLHLFPLALLVLLLAYTVQHARQLHQGQVVSLALIFSGGAGNLVDRLFYDSRVPDFMILRVQSLHTGIFNVADVCISAGVAMMLGFALFAKRQD